MDGPSVPQREEPRARLAAFCSHGGSNFAAIAARLGPMVKRSPIGANPTFGAKNSSTSAMSPKISVSPM